MHPSDKWYFVKNYPSLDEAKEWIELQVKPDEYRIYANIFCYPIKE